MGGFNGEDQHRIANDFLLPELAANVGMEKDEVTLESRAACDFAAEQYGCEKPGHGDGGLRGLRQALEACVLQVNKLRLIHDAHGGTDGLPPVLARGPRIE